MVVVLAVFVVCVLVLAWAFAGYPAALYALSKLRPNPVQRQPHFPQVTALICTYQEAKVIERRLDNLLESDYPLDCLEILVVDSASTDGTPDLVDEYRLAHPQATVRLIREDVRRGKVAGINLGLTQARGEIVVLSDAATLFWPDTLRLILENFADPKVGGATGKWIHFPYRDETPAQSSRRPVVGYRNVLRRLESQIDSTYAVTGELLAFRRSLIPSIPSHIGQDDLYIALSVREQGSRVIADPRAFYTEKSASTYSDLVEQKKKESAGCTQLLIWFRRMIFNPRYGLYGLMILPTKVIHSPLSPVVLGLALIGGSLLAVYALGPLTSLLIALGIALAFGVLWLYHRGWLFTVVTGFLLSEWILFRGLMMYLRGEYTGVWKTIPSTREE